MGDTNGLGFELASIAAMEHEQRDRLGRQAMGAIRSIATIIGCPADADPLTDLDGLVSMARGMAERVVGVEARIADAVAAERYAAGAWIRSRPDARPIWAQCIEHGDHIDDDAPPLPSLRMTLLLRDELHRQIATLTAERDRRIDPVEHARAVRDCFVTCFTGALMEYGSPLPQAEMLAAGLWLESVERATLLARVGADVLAEVER